MARTGVEVQSAAGVWQGLNGLQLSLRQTPEGLLTGWCRLPDVVGECAVQGFSVGAMVVFAVSVGGSFAGVWLGEPDSGGCSLLRLWRLARAVRVSDAIRITDVIASSVLLVRVPEAAVGSLTAAAPRFTND